MADSGSDSTAVLRERVEQLILAAEQIGAAELAPLAQRLGVPLAALVARGGLQRGDQRLAPLREYIAERLAHEGPLYLMGLAAILELRRVLLPAPPVPNPN